MNLSSILQKFREDWPNPSHEFVVDGIHALMMLSRVKTTTVQRNGLPIRTTLIEGINEVIFGHSLNKTGNVVLDRLPEEGLHGGEETAEIVGGNHDVAGSVTLAFEESLIVKADIAGVIHLASLNHSREASLTTFVDTRELLYDGVVIFAFLAKAELLLALQDRYWVILLLHHRG